jgi:Protein of unknown function (DUF3829)
MNKKILVTMLLLSLGLAACNKNDTGAAAGSNSKTDASEEASDPAVASDSDEDWSNKVQAYIKIGNRLQGFSSSMNETFAKWQMEADEKVKNGDFKEIRTNSHYFSDSDVKDLKEAIAMPGATPELDKAAKLLLTNIETYLPNWNNLQEYNKAKRYEDDNGAKGKEMLPKYIEGMEKIEVSLDALQAEIDSAGKVEHAKTVAQFKKDGQLLEMHTWEATGSAQKVLDLFSSDDDFKDAAKIKQADAHIASMETSLAAIKVEHAKRKAEDEKVDSGGEKSLPLIDRYDSVHDELNEMAGHYRESRKDPSKFNDAVGSYNDAIDALNMMNR